MLLPIPGSGRSPRRGPTPFRRRSLGSCVAAVLAAGVLGAAPAHAAPDVAPGAPGGGSTWTSGAKVGVGTAVTEQSKVWYTLVDGLMSEVYYPRVDVANVQDLQLVVTDGSTFTELERDATTHEVVLADPQALSYQQVNTDRDGRYRITKSYVTDPARSTVLVDVRVDSLDGGRYTAYVLYNPSLANSGLHDSGSTVGSALVAEDTGGDTPVASALVASPAFARVSTGFSGVSDGWTDLRDDHRLDRTYGSSPDGNVVQVGQLATQGNSRTLRATIALGFGPSGTDALTTAQGSLRRAFPAVRDAYEEGWAGYLASLDAAPASVAGDPQLRTQYDVALMTLKAHEDKTYPGANIASLTVPWGQAIDADESGVGGYHLVWARDLYQVATAQLAAGDEAAANRSLDYLFDVQQRPDGSFPQNTLLDGTPYWGSLQLDEVALPLVLAGQLGRFDADTWEHVERSADFLVARGPSTPQERWEEEGGYSPSTIAAEIAGLVTAAEIARRNGDGASAALYTGVADDWQRRLEEWTFTTTGPHGDGRYFVRIDANGNPDGDDWVEINNGGGWHPEREVVDAGFLELVRLGVRPAGDPSVLASLPELDEIRVDTPHGPMWYRYGFDGYGEKADGSPYDGTGVGRLWPLLSGERGEYELAAGRSADAFLRTMAGAANEGLMIPEQVWDRPDAAGFRFGEGTGSATPLAWSMAQFVRLAVSIDAGRPVETPALVADRYADGALPEGPALTVTAPADGARTDAGRVEVTGTTDGAEVHVATGGETVAAQVVDGAFTATVPVSTGRNTVTVVAVGEDGGTSVVRRTVVSTAVGTPVGVVDDPAGDDHGPGSYVYPTNAAFVPGAFDVTRFGVYDDGPQVNFVVTLDGEVTNPWGGNQISVQRFDVYVRAGDGEGAVPALPGTNAALAAPYDLVVTADGFTDLGVRDAAGTTVSGATLTAVPESRQVVVSVPRSALGDLDLAGAEYALVMASHADGTGEGVGNVRPVYDLAYWQSAPERGTSWIQEYRFGGGAGEWTDATAARDTDTRDPNALDVLVPPGSTQADVLDWTRGAPVTLPYVSLTGA
ncbi:glucan 1,4-alpha-glucosidase [Geodermatophilus sp. SYSU D01062]